MAQCTTEIMTVGNGLMWLQDPLKSVVLQVQTTQYRIQSHSGGPHT